MVAADAIGNTERVLLRADGTPSPVAAALREEAGDTVELKELISPKNDQAGANEPHSAKRVFQKVGEAQADSASQGSTSNMQIAKFAFCFVGLQASYLTWGYIQEKVMTKEYATGKFPSATFCVFSNRIFAIVVAALVVVWRTGSPTVPAPLKSFAPCSISNSISSYAQYDALHYVSFPLQTLTKSAKVIPVMLMGKLLHKKSYPWIDYAEALALSIGVYIFSCSEGKHHGKEEMKTEVLGVLMLITYITSDSFTSQWQSRVFKDHPAVDQFQMMMATNLWSIILTLTTLILTGELWVSIAFLKANPDALLDNVTIATTSATGQLFIFYTIKSFGPIAFTVIMTTRQLFSMVLSAVLFGHPLGFTAYIGTAIVFLTLFFNISRKWKKGGQAKG
mmetsp:Transcript_57504/g.136797  ORF Transcript_57504/g.136797 Transcript_57504/m.136797 type:complete len:393 (+) Transcript_57504:79-1257(+)